MGLSLEVWLAIAGFVIGNIVTVAVAFGVLKQRVKTLEDRSEKHEENFNGFGKLLRTKRWQAEEDERCAIAEAKARELEERKKRLNGKG